MARSLLGLCRIFKEDLEFLSMTAEEAESISSMLRKQKANAAARSLFMQLGQTGDWRLFVMAEIPRFLNDTGCACHPRVESDLSEEELMCKQADFFKTGPEPAAQILERKETKPVLGDVLERASATTFRLPTIAPAPLPKHFSKPTASSKTAHQAPIQGGIPTPSLRQEISRENEALLATLHPDEITALQLEMHQCVPEAFLGKLRDRNKQ